MYFLNYYEKNRELLSFRVDDELSKVRIRLGTVSECSRGCRVAEQIQLSDYLHCLKEHGWFFIRRGLFVLIYSLISYMCAYFIEYVFTSRDFTIFPKIT